MSHASTSSLKEKYPNIHIEIFLYRAPKKNHDAMMEVNRKSRDFFMKHGASNFEVFSLENRNNIMEFVNLSKTISASEEEEVWLEIQSYRDVEHVKEFSKSMEGDTSMEPLYKDFMQLITPGSVVSFGGFNKLVQVSFNS
ncbi:DUF1428 family protein [Candidatus Nitrosocosmicus sp. T]